MTPHDQWALSPAQVSPGDEVFTPYHHPVGGPLPERAEPGSVEASNVWNHPVRGVRAVGMIEGVSYLLLLGVAMPLKYLSGMPELGEKVVFWVGLAHGILFTAYAAVAFRAHFTGHLSNKLLGYAAIASLLPFGPFVIDRRLKEAEEAQSPPAAG